MIRLFWFPLRSSATSAVNWFYTSLNHRGAEGRRGTGIQQNDEPGQMFPGPVVCDPLIFELNCRS
jgi:hypothetical protein